MRLKDVPLAPAYYVFHDAYMKGAMDVYPADSLEIAKQRAERNQKTIEENGAEDSGMWRAYEKLPRVKVWAFHTPVVKRCDCESRDCHPKADCQRPAKIRTTHSRVCGPCAAKMPAKELAQLIQDTVETYIKSI